MIAPARTAAYQILRDVRRGRSDLATAAALARLALTDERDRALALEVASGALRWQLTLDHVIAHFARRPPHKLDPEVLDILRIAAYQLLHLTRVPASAVVNDAVKMTRACGKGSASGFANAVLRSLSRARQQLPLPTRPATDASPEQWAAYLSVVQSHPQWLIARWMRRLGLAVTEQWLHFNNESPPLTLRVNRRRSTLEALLARLEAGEVPVERGRFSPDALRVEAGAMFRAASVPADHFLVQDEASQLVARLVGPRPGRLVLDTCASPGGKTTAIAAVYDDPQAGTVIACDVRTRRMSLLGETVRMAGTGNVRLVQADAEKPLPFSRSFDSVIVDAPCSGLGTLRRDPDIKWRRQEHELPVLAASQLTMLQHAAAVVVPGGHLVYATCSTEPEENEEVAQRFLEARSDYRPLDATNVDPVLAPVVDARGHLRTAPDRHGLEGFFGAVFERTR